MDKQVLKIRKTNDNSSITIYNVSKNWKLTQVDKIYNSILSSIFTPDNIIELRKPSIVLHNYANGTRYITTYHKLPAIPEADSNLLIFDCENDGVIDGDKFKYTNYLFGLCPAIRIPRDGKWIKIKSNRIPSNNISHGFTFACYRNNELFVSHIGITSSNLKIHRISENDNTLHIGTKIYNTKDDDEYNWRYVNTVRESLKVSPSM